MIYQDSRIHGAWHHCSSCGTYGDMIELAARTWKVDLPAAIRRLANLGLDFPQGTDDLIIGDYMRYSPERREHLTKLLQDGADCLQGDDRGGYIGLLRQLHITTEMSARQWQERMGQWIGGANYRTIDVALRPWLQNTDKWLNSGGKCRIFCGGGWREVIMIPFHDLPERVCGLLLIGRHCRRDDRIFRTMLGRSSSNRAEARLPVEAGLCLYSAALKTANHKDFGQDLIVCQDPLLAIAMQAKHLRTSLTPLPLVGAYSADIMADDKKPVRVASHTVWQTLSGRRLLFWGPQLTAAIINMAAQANGHISICAAPRGDQIRPPREWFFTVQRQAVPWEAALDRWLQQADTNGIQALLPGLQLPGDVMQHFRRRCSTTAKSRLQQFEQDPNRLQVVHLGKRVVMETARGWVDGQTGNTICSATLQIQRMLYQESTGDIYYQGHIGFDGQQYPFLERQTVVDKGTFNWMRAQLVAAGAGISTYDNTWSRYAIDIAILLHHPTIEQGVGTFGWRPDKQAFILPAFKLPYGGQPQECVSHVLDNISPAVGVLPDKLQPPNCKALTTDSPAHQAFWATAAAIGANIVAPALNKPVAGVGLLGTGATVMGCMTARLWGCAEYAMKLYASAVEIAAELQDRCSRHRWPLLLQLPSGKRRSLLTHWLHADPQQNVVLDVDSYLAEALRTQSRWRFVTSDAPITAAPSVADYGQHALFMWLADLCQRRIRLPAGEHLAQQVLQDMAAWAAKYEGDAEFILGCHQLLDEALDEVDQAMSFIALLYRCIDEGVLRFQRAGFEDDTTPHSIFHLDLQDRPAGVFIPRAAVNKVFAERGVPVPDPVQLTGILAEAGGLECEYQYAGMSGWLLNYAWWERQVAQCHAQQSRILRIVS